MYFVVEQTLQITAHFYIYTSFGVVRCVRNLALLLGELSAQPTERGNMTIASSLLNWMALSTMSLGKDV